MLIYLHNTKIQTLTKKTYVDAFSFVNFKRVQSQYPPSSNQCLITYLFSFSSLFYLFIIILSSPWAIEKKHRLKVLYQNCLHRPLEAVSTGMFINVQSKLTDDKNWNTNLVYPNGFSLFDKIGILSCFSILIDLFLAPPFFFVRLRFILNLWFRFKFEICLRNLSKKNPNMGHYTYFFCLFVWIFRLRRFGEQPILHRLWYCYLHIVNIELYGKLIFFPFSTGVNSYNPSSQYGFSQVYGSGSGYQYNRPYNSLTYPNNYYNGKHFLISIDFF